MTEATPSRRIVICGAGKIGCGHLAALFAEDQGLYVATICDNCLLTFLARAHAAGVEVEAIGRTCGSRLIFELPQGDHCVPLAELRQARERVIRLDWKVQDMVLVPVEELPEQLLPGLADDGAVGSAARPQGRAG